MTTENGNGIGGIDSPLTAEQASELMKLAESGDTSVLGLDFGGGPTPAPASSDDGKSTTGEEGKTAGADEGTKPGGEGENKGAIPEDQQTADNTVILAKDGKHTIAFDHLAKARQQRDEAEAKAIAAEATATAAQAELQKLRDEAAQREAQGKAPTKMDNLTAQAEQAIKDGADAELFGDFSESALKAGIEKLVDQRVEARVAALVDAKLAPIVAKDAKAAENEHEAFIFGKHPNAVSIVESTEFAAWVATLPKVAQPAIWATFAEKTGGTAEEIVGILDDYTKATGAPKPQPTPSDAAKAAADKAVSEAGKEPPISITSIPGARAAGTTLAESMTTMDGTEMYQAMENWTPAQIESFLNKQL